MQWYFVKPPAYPNKLFVFDYIKYRVNTMVNKFIFFNSFDESKSYTQYNSSINIFNIYLNIILFFLTKDIKRKIQDEISRKF